jgi:hypothetical protein
MSTRTPQTRKIRAKEKQKIARIPSAQPHREVQTSKGHTQQPHA